MLSQWIAESLKISIKIKIFKRFKGEIQYKILFLNRLVIKIKVISWKIIVEHFLKFKIFKNNKI